MKILDCEISHQTELFLTVSVYVEPEEILINNTRLEKNQRIDFDFYYTEEGKDKIEYMSIEVVSIEDCESIDGGIQYFSKEEIQGMLKFIQNSDICTPNITEYINYKLN